MTTVLIVDDEENARVFISNFLTSRGYEVIDVATLAGARQCIRQGKGDLILLDVTLTDGYGPDLLVETAGMPMRPPIILITAHGDIDMAVNAMKNGAHDFLQKPIQFVELEKSIVRATELVSLRRELAHLREYQSTAGFIVGKTPEMARMLNQAERAATASVSVLITGETGTGKEVLARFIHKHGPRASKPFIAINCAAIQNTMLEAELFGYESGAFTGADKRKPGLIEVADGGVLFLDEISSMALDMQAKMLRAIEERAFYRVGGTALIKVNVQILAASNRNLPTMIKDERFREDLYYRLKVVDLNLVPLRARKVDIPDLTGHFVHMFNGRMGMNVTEVTTRALQVLMAYDWPGNIRELQNTIERAMLFCDEEAIDLQHLSYELVALAAQVPA